MFPKKKTRTGAQKSPCYVSRILEGQCADTENFKEKKRVLRNVRSFMKTAFEPMFAIRIMIRKDSSDYLLKTNFCTKLAFSKGPLMLHQAPTLCVIAYDMLNAVVRYIINATLKFNYDKCSQLNYRTYFYLMFIYLHTHSFLGKKARSKL